MGWIDEEAKKQKEKNNRFNMLKGKMEKLWTKLVEFCNNMPEEIRLKVCATTTGEPLIMPSEIKRFLKCLIFSKEQTKIFYAFDGTYCGVDSTYIFFSSEKNSYVITTKERFERRGFLFSREEVEEWVFYPIRITDVEQIIKNIYYQQEITCGFQRLLKEEYENFSY